MKHTKEEILAKLNSVAKPATTWLEDAQYRADNSENIKKAQRIALIVLRTIRARKMSQVALAEKMDTTPQLVNKWLKGKENFTLSTIEKLENALEIKLIQIVAPKADLKVVRGGNMTVKIDNFEKREISRGTYKMTVVKSEKTLVTAGLTRSKIPAHELCQA